MCSLKTKSQGFLLAESLISLTISLLIISTLTLTITEENRMLQKLETRASAHKLIRQKLKSEDIPEHITISGRDYLTTYSSNQISVRSGSMNYEVKW